MENEDHQKQISEMTSSSSDKPDKNPNLDLAMSLQHEDQCSDEDNNEDSESDEEIDEEDEEFDYEQELGFLEEGGDESEMDEDEIIDPEELMELGDPIGAAEDRGLSKDKIPLCLCPTNYRAVITGGTDQCVVCQTEYEEGEPVVGLISCMHVYHAKCITPWLRVKKTCPVCNMEISPPPTVEDVAKTKI